MTAPELRAGPRAGPEEPSGGAPPEAAEARIAAIVAGARVTRRRPSRGAWIAAAIVGAICAIGFVLLVAVEGQPEERAGSPEPARARARGGASGCLGGLGLGLGLGVAIGLGLARRQPGDHSSRRRP